MNSKPNKLRYSKAFTYWAFSVSVKKSLTNALMTLQEYLLDYSDAATANVGAALIKRELQNIPDEKIRRIVSGHLEKIKEGSRDFRI